MLRRAVGCSASLDRSLRRVPPFQQPAERGERLRRTLLVRKLLAEAVIARVDHRADDAERDAPGPDDRANGERAGSTTSQLEALAPEQASDVTPLRLHIGVRGHMSVHECLEGGVHVSSLEGRERPNAPAQLQRIQSGMRAERAQSVAILCQMRRSFDGGGLDPYMR